MAIATAKISHLIGREDELDVAHLTLMRTDVRLLSLTGPGGVGKTRLALELIAELTNAFADGAYVVQLGEVREAGLVLFAIAETLGLTDDGSVPITERLQAKLASTEVLLTLDNFEHVAAAAPAIERLLEACPKVKVLATSRAPLRLAGEQIVMLHPLRTPVLSESLSLDELGQNEAVRLLTQRVQAFDADFALSAGNAADIADICTRTGGLPLAIELAALRLQVLSPAALRRRLASPMAVLGRGNNSHPHRQQTLRATFAWTEKLLDSSCQSIFRRISVFAGGFDAAAAEAVCGGPTNGATLTSVVLDHLTELLNYGLINRAVVAGDPRFTMPETIREYAAESLEMAGEAETTHHRHAAYFLALAEDASPAMLGPDQEAWVMRLETEHHNFRRALQWSLANAPIVSLRMAAALWRFWQARGHIREGRQWLDRAVATGSGAESVTLVRALHGLGVLVGASGNLERALELQNASLSLARKIGDRWGVAAAQGDHAIVEFLLNGDAVRARTSTERVLVQFRALGDRYSEGLALTTLGTIACSQGDLEMAACRFQEALDIARESGDSHRVELCLCNLALTARLGGELDRAVTFYTEALELAHRLGSQKGLLYALAGIGGAVIARRQFERGVRLLSAATALAETVGMSLQPLERTQFEHDAETARAALNNAVFSQAWEAGRTLPVDSAAAEVLKRPGATNCFDSGHGLSGRELEVLPLLAAGNSDRDIATALYISPETATTHVKHIRTKLGVHSRGAAAAFAVRHGLV